MAPGFLSTGPFIALPPTAIVFACKCFVVVLMERSAAGDDELEGKKEQKEESEIRCFAKGKTEEGIR
jgi:hypothetical protein